MIAWLRLITGFDGVVLQWLGYRSGTDLGDHGQIQLSGKVYQKKSDKIYLSSIYVFQICGDSADASSQSNEIIKLKENLILEKPLENQE